MAHTKIAKTTLALAAALIATALAPALAAAGESASASSSAHATPAAQGGHARHTASGGSAAAGTASLGATAAPRADEAQPEGRTGGHGHDHHRARAQRYLRRHGHHHHRHHHHHGHRHRPHLSEISYEGSSLATWFGPGLYGRHTACGQILTKQLAGVANRTLACGTLVEVTYNGRSVTVPVVDRGPYSSIGASWDLTAKTAELLGMTETAQIETKIVGHAKNSPSLGSLAGSSLPEQSLLEEEAQQQQAGPTGGAVAS